MNVTRRNRLRKQQKKWTIEEDKVMVQMIEERPSIWDYASPEYRHLDTKNKCWADVAENTNHSVVDAKNHWNTVKSRFNLERKKVLQHKGGAFSSNYELYEPLQFLTTVEGRPPGRIATTNHLAFKSETHDLDDSRSTLTTPSTSDRNDSVRITTSSSTKRKRKPFTPPAPVQNPKRIALLGEIADIIKSREEVSPAKRWKKVFLEYISCELDRYEDNDAQNLKNQIMTACINFEPQQ